ncbi:MAG: hypothetical protein R3D88_07920 [Alphaproteobacteria bacterium]|nr:hypothetical protein [Alphaproteobacteria bacterium]
MTAVAGSSRYANAATLANARGIAPSTPNVLGTGGSTVSLLDAGRRDTGVGLSGRARAVTNQLISQSRSGFNQLFSLNGVEFGSTETLSQKIKAIRASLPESALSRGVLEDQEV